MRRRLFKFTVLGLLTAAAMTVAAGAVYRVHRHRQIASETPINPAAGIDEEFFAPIGGIDQWISIRGQRRDNPVLLFVHGGPGLATSPYPRNFLFALTRDFTLVRWDQRGAGRTFGRSGPVGANITRERMAQDGIDVAEFIRARLHAPKLILVGHSWGSSLGVRMARLRPDLFYAYVGTGQSVDQDKYKVLAYQLILAEARARHDAAAIGELEANGPPPYSTTAKARVHTKWATRYEAGQPTTTWEMLSMVLFDSDVSPHGIVDYGRGIATSEDHFRGEPDDLMAMPKDFRLPFFVFQGADDYVTPVAPVREYVAQVTAPRKELVLIPGAGHNAIATRTEAFRQLLLDRVKPSALSPQP